MATWEKSGKIPRVKQLQQNSFYNNSMKEIQVVLLQRVEAEDYFIHFVPLRDKHTTLWSAPESGNL